MKLTTGETIAPEASKIAVKISEVMPFDKLSKAPSDVTLIAELTLKSMPSVPPQLWLPFNAAGVSYATTALAGAATAVAAMAAVTRNFIMAHLFKTIRTKSDVINDAKIVPKMGLL